MTLESNKRGLTSTGYKRSSCLHSSLLLLFHPIFGLVIFHFRFFPVLHEARLLFFRFVVEVCPYFFSFMVNGDIYIALGWGQSISGYSKRQKHTMVDIIGI